MHILYRYPVFDEICIGVEACRPYPQLHIFVHMIHDMNLDNLV